MSVGNNLTAAMCSWLFVDTYLCRDCSSCFARIITCFFPKRHNSENTPPRVKRSAYWFLGEYCCQLTGSPTHTGPAVSSPQSADQSPTSKPKPSGGDDLLGVWGSSAPSRSEGGAARPPSPPASGLDGLEAAATAVAHPVVSAMNGATISIMMRLKHAAMFEDFQVRRTAADVCRRWVGCNQECHIVYTPGRQWEGGGRGASARVVFCARNRNRNGCFRCRRLIALCLVSPWVLL